MPAVAPSPAPPPARPEPAGPALPPRCLNCDGDLVGPFCAACGQRVQTVQQPLGVFGRDLFGEYFGLDGRLWRTGGLLLFRPGALTVAYVGGRRTRYLRPFRIYLSATLLFFVTLSLVQSGEGGFARGLAAGLAGEADVTLPAADARARLDAEAVRLEQQAAGLQDAPATADLLARRAEALRARRAGLGGVADTARVTLSAAEAGWGPEGFREGDSSDVVEGVFSQVGAKLPPWMKGRLIRRFETAETAAEKQAALDEAFSAVVAQVPTAMLFVLPLFALILKGLYVRGGGVGRPRDRGKRRPPPRPAPGGAGLPVRLGQAVLTLGVRAVNGWRRWRVARRRRRARRFWRRGARWAWSRAVPVPFRVRRFAWLRRAVAARRRRFVAEHLVFALHAHAYAFAVFFLLVVVGRQEGAGWEQAATLLALSIPAHVLLALRRVYAQAWGRTVLKATGLLLGYSVVLALGLVLAAALAARLG